MPMTPVAWLDSVIANLTETGNQNDPNILQLNNGNILISWTSEYDGSGSTSSGSNSGYDIIGQIFSPLGTPVGSEILLSTAFTSGTVGRQQADIGALPDGGFIVAYEEASDTTRPFGSIRIETFDAFGTPVNSSPFLQDTSSSFSNYRNPNLAVGATTVMVAYDKVFSDTDIDVKFSIYTPATNTFSSEFFVDANGGFQADPDVTVLSNGNFVVVYTDDFGTGDSEIKMRIFDANGATVRDVTPVGQHVTNQPDSEPHVVGLTGGGFAVSWNNSDGTDNDVYVQIFNTTGNPETGRIAVNDEGDTDVNSRSNIVDMPDGGFIVFYEDAETGNEGGRGQRFDAAGAPVGDSFMFNMTKAWDVEAVLLGDGRVALTYWDDEIKLHIVDSRDMANDPGVYTPDQYQIGTIFDDMITPDAISEVVAAWDGNDTINESGQERVYLGGKGDDLFNVTSIIDSDAHDGGDDIDTIDWSGSNESGATFDLGNGTATNADGSAAETMRWFENFIGTEFAETIIGSNDANMIDGRGGNDTITGLEGDDMLMGGSGEDSIDGGDDNDTIDGGADNDSLFGGDGEDSIMGSSGDDSLDGGAGNDTLEGGADNDTVMGNDGDDMLSGGDGDDTLEGGSENDTLNGDAGNDMLSGGFDDDMLNGGFDNDTLLGNEGNDTLNGDEGNDSLNGGEGDDSLMGGADNDILNGGDASSGTDTLMGGTGDDLYLVEDSNDMVVEAADEGTDRVETSMSYTLSDNVENLILTGTADVNGTGNAGGNMITGNSGNNRLDGGTGTDMLIGGLGDDVYVTDDGDTVVESSGGGIDRVESSADVTLSASVENLTLTGTDAINGTGNVLSNMIMGNNSQNVLDGAGGTDTMMGGGGDDVYITDGGDIISETADGGVDRVESSVSHILETNLENLTLTGLNAINGTGNELANMLIGNGAANILAGLAGADTMAGGAGDDAYIVDSLDTITEAAGEGTDQVRSSDSYTLGDNLENLMLTGAGNIAGTGNALANEIFGNSGNNMLDGGAGDDTMRGGAGDDQYFVDSASDLVDELAGEGRDSVFSNTEFFTLDANVEDLFLNGPAALNGIGNAGDNRIEGNGASNRLEGKDGNDTLLAGEGDNTVLGDAGNDSITAGSGDDFIGGGAGNDSITVDGGTNRVYGGFGNDTVNGGTGDDLIVGGGSGANVLKGNDGDDAITGGSGNDFLAGGEGNDVITGVAGANRIYTGLGDDTVNGGSDNDNIFGAGDGTNRMVGNAGNDVIRAGAGGDFMGGGAGNDTVLGGDGNDTVYGGAGNDLIGGGAGNDLLYGSAGSNRIYTGPGNDTVQGGTGNDTIYGAGTDGKTNYGNGGNDLVYGAAGDDLLAGGSGNDSVFGFDGDDLIYLGTGNDFVGGGAGDDNITAGAGNNRIYAGEGDDTVNAGVGRDVITGGTGADVFVFNSAPQAGIGAARDVITDFQVGIDHVNLEPMNLSFIGSGPFTGGSAQLAYLGGGATGFLVGDVDGDGTADFAIELSGAPALSAGDLIL